MLVRIGGFNNEWSNGFFMVSREKTYRSRVLKLIMALAALSGMADAFVKGKRLNVGKVDIDFSSVISVLVLLLTMYQSMIETILICRESLLLRDELRGEVVSLRSDAVSVDVSIVLPQVPSLQDSTWSQNRYRRAGSFGLLLIIVDLFMGSRYLTGSTTFAFMILDYFAAQEFERWDQVLKIIDKEIICKRQEISNVIIERLKKEVQDFKQENQTLKERLGETAITLHSEKSSESDEQFSILSRFFQEMTSKAVRNFQSIFEEGGGLEFSNRR